MASTYTPAGIELIADGEQSTTWGDTTNTNWELMEEMVGGVVSISLSSTTYTLTTTDGASSNGRHAVVVFTGSPGGTCTVTVSPNDMQKVYFIVNNSDQTVTLSQGSGANVSVSASKTKVVYCDGAGSGAAVVDISGGFDSTTLAELGVTASAAELNIMDGVTATTAELNILDGVTATTAELNIMDGVTATAAELNILDGATLSTTELNYVDGVTSAIQTQLNSLDSNKASLASPALTGTPTAPTASLGTDTTQIATTAFVQDALSAAYPVGSVYINASVSTNPATLLGFGTWASFGAGRVLVGVDSGDTSFDTLGETGGSKDAIAVSHTHTFTTDSGGSHSHVITNARKGGGGPSGISHLPIYDNNGGTEMTTDTAAAHTHTGTTASSGSSGTNANLQPYITVYMWKRTA